MRPVIHDGHLSLLLATNRRHVQVLDSNGRSDGIEVSWDGVIALEWVFLSEVEFLVNHLKTICIYKHLLSSVKAVQESPINNDVFTSFVRFDRYLVQLNCEFDEVIDAV